MAYNEKSNTSRVPLKDLQTFKGRAKHLFYIQNKDGELVPFEFLEYQDILNDIIQEEFKRTKKEFGTKQCRLITVKPRQAGQTTFTELFSLDMQMQIEGCHGVIAAHDQDTTDLIYDIYKRAYDNLPEYVIPTKDGEDLTQRQYLREVLSEKEFSEISGDLQSSEYDKIHKIPVKPEIDSYSGKRIAFKDTNARTTIFTAGKGDAGGKGVTIRRIHLSEAANFPDYSSLIKSINPSVPKFADNMFYVIESTANGTTGTGEGFYKAYKRAEKEWEKYKQGKQQTFMGFRPVFVPWYMIDEYELPLAGGKFEDISEVDFGTPEEKRSFLEREKELMEEGIVNPLTGERVVLSPAKINWYRWIIKVDCEFDYRSAQRYYPTTPEEAFTASSNCWFDAMKLNNVKNTYKNESEPEYELGRLEWNDDNEIEFIEDGHGSLKIFSTPEPNWDSRYVIGADIGRGYEEGDYSTAYVKDRLTEDIVAYWHGRIDQDLFADVLSELGIYYNEALLVPESNLDTVINIIKPDGRMPYTGEIYYTGTGASLRWGYYTAKGRGSGSRKVMLDNYKAWLRDNPNGYYVLPDIDTINEHISFVRKVDDRGNTKYEADEGEHDDRVLSLALTDVGDRWWEETPEEYKPNKVMEVLSKPFRRKKKTIRNARVGRSKRT